MVGTQIYFYFQYEQSVHSVEHYTYLWDNSQLGERLVAPDHRDPVRYSSTIEILPEFLLLTGLPALFSLAISFAVYWFKNAGKRRTF